MSTLNFTYVRNDAKLVKRAEKIINDALACDNTFIYLENPDGTKVRILAGAKLNFIQYYSVKDGITIEGIPV